MLHLLSQIYFVTTACSTLAISYKNFNHLNAAVKSQVSKCKWKQLIFHVAVTATDSGSGADDNYDMAMKQRPPEPDRAR